MMMMIVICLALNSPLVTVSVRAGGIAGGFILISYVDRLGRKKEAAAIALLSWIANQHKKH
jgi:hypothetical protein